MPALRVQSAAGFHFGQKAIDFLVALELAETLLHGIAHQLRLGLAYGLAVDRPFLHSVEGGREAMHAEDGAWRAGIQAPSGCVLARFGLGDPQGW
jgi:hypothetical protein